VRGNERKKIGKESNINDGSNETQECIERGRVPNGSGITTGVARDLQRRKTQAGVDTTLRFCWVAGWLDPLDHLLLAVVAWR
jgi:hypothetical protein